MLPWNGKCNLACCWLKSHYHQSKCATVRQCAQERPNSFALVQKLNTKKLNGNEARMDEWMNGMNTSVGRPFGQLLTSTLKQEESKWSKISIGSSNSSHTMHTTPKSTEWSELPLPVKALSASVHQLSSCPLSLLNLNCSPITGKSPSSSFWAEISVFSVANVSTVMAKLPLLLLLQSDAKLANYRPITGSVVHEWREQNCCGNLDWRSREISEGERGRKGTKITGLIYSQSLSTNDDLVVKLALKCEKRIVRRQLGASHQHF